MILLYVPLMPLKLTEKSKWIVS